MAGDREQERKFRAMARIRADSGDGQRHRSPLRLHAQIRSGIRRGVVSVHDRLDEDLLVRTYSTSRNSVRAALTLLAEEGIVSRGPRHGTVVMADIDDIRIDNGMGWSIEESPRHQVKSLSTTRIPTTPLIRDLLQTDAEFARVTHLVDLRDGEPFLIYINYTSDDSPERVMTNQPRYVSFEHSWEAAYGSPLARIDCSVQAVSSDEATAKLLQVAPGSALLLKERLLWDATGMPREFSHTYYIASHTALTTTTWSSPGHDPR